MLIVGKKEAAGTMVSVRRHKQGDLGVMSTRDFLERVLDEINRKVATT
jgi:threonyl-tRNA synthetase